MDMPSTDVIPSHLINFVFLIPSVFLIIFLDRCLWSAVPPGILQIGERERSFRQVAGEWRQAACALGQHVQEGLRWSPSVATVFFFNIGKWYSEWRIMFIKDWCLWCDNALHRDMHHGLGELDSTYKPLLSFPSNRTKSYKVGVSIEEKQNVFIWKFLISTG